MRRDFPGRHSSPGPASGTEILTADSGLNELTSELPTQTVKTYRLFWPSGSENDAPRLPQNATYTRSQLTHRWTQVKLNAFAGLLSTSLVEESSVVGWTYRVIGKGAEVAPAMPPKCPNCDADFGGRDRNPTPLRNHRTAFQKSCQVLATALAREIPLHGEKRRLVLFSDSRQDAAKLAAGVENDHYRDLLRIAMLEAPSAFWKPFVALLHVLSRKAPELLDKLEINPSLRADAASGTFLGERINGAQRLAQRLSVDDVALAAALQSWALEMPAADQDRKAAPPAYHELSRQSASPGSSEHRQAQVACERRTPGGIIAYWLQTFRDDSDVRRPWYDLLDWPEAPEEQEPLAIRRPSLVRSYRPRGARRADVRAVPTPRADDRGARPYVCGLTAQAAPRGRLTRLRPPTTVGIRLPITPDNTLKSRPIPARSPPTANSGLAHRMVDNHSPILVHPPSPEHPASPPEF